MSGEIKDLESYYNPVITKNGKIKMIKWNNTVLKDDRGRIVATLSAGIDITDEYLMINKKI